MHLDFKVGHTEQCLLEYEKEKKPYVRLCLQDNDDKLCRFHS